MNSEPFCPIDLSIVTVVMFASILNGVRADILGGILIDVLDGILVEIIDTPLLILLMAFLCRSGSIGYFCTPGDTGDHHFPQGVTLVVHLASCGNRTQGMYVS